MKTILEAKMLTKVYGTDRKNVILKDVNLEIKKGELRISEKRSCASTICLTPV